MMGWRDPVFTRVLVDSRPGSIYCSDIFVQYNTPSSLTFGRGRRGQMRVKTNGCERHYLVIAPVSPRESANTDRVVSDAAQIAGMIGASSRVYRYLNEESSVSCGDGARETSWLGVLDDLRSQAHLHERSCEVCTSTEGPRYADGKEEDYLHILNPSADSTKSFLRNPEMALSGALRVVPGVRHIDMEVIRCRACRLPVAVVETSRRITSEKRVDQSFAFARSLGVPLLVAYYKARDRKAPALSLYEREDDAVLDKTILEIFGSEYLSTGYAPKLTGNADAVMKDALSEIADHPCFPWERSGENSRRIGRREFPSSEDTHPSGAEAR